MTNLAEWIVIGLAILGAIVITEAVIYALLKVIIP